MTWDELPLRLNLHHIAQITDVHERTARQRVIDGSPLVPAPDFIKPYGWRKDKVRRWFETASVPYLRRELAKHEATS